MIAKRMFLTLRISLAASALVLLVASTQPATGATLSGVDRRSAVGDWRATAVGANGVAASDPLTCNGNIDGQVTAAYTGTTLSSTRTDYAAKMSCTSGPHGETMTALQETPIVRLNGTDVHEGPTGKCGTATPATPCSQVEARGSYTCTGSKTCAGDYQIGHRSLMILPAGFEWRDVPAGCQKTAPRDLHCIWLGGVVTVRENLPSSPPSTAPTANFSSSPSKSAGSGDDIRNS
ncbi:hypothetical protein [Fodinicola acaciae]|uniref:hypothetical protein n=1 Tax=Fodinicola acaciae TaxID=2681555 RepID=UPI0013D7988F|nr:hypothetical protein [Fodinicola acaciae]